MKWVISLSLGAVLAFFPSGYAEEEESFFDDFSTDSGELLSIEEDDETVDEELEEEAPFEASVRPEKHTENALKSIKVKPVRQVAEEAPVKIEKAVPEKVPEAAKPAPIEKIKVEADESPAMHIDEKLQENEPLAPAQKTVASEESSAVEIDLKQVFNGAPIIYTLLAVLSIVAFSIWLYSMMMFRPGELLPDALLRDLKNKLISNQFTDALMLCQKEKHFFCKMVATGILARKQGLGIMVEMMKAEGKRSTVGFWQRLNLLNDIAIIAPMLGLLGTVMGMFYAFYDLHRSSESLSILFDGLGISVGTTIAGLVVAIIAMVLHSIAKYRLVKALATVENEAQGLAALIETKGPSYLEI